MTKAEIKEKIAKLQKGIESPATPEKYLTELKKLKDNLQKELSQMEAEEQKPSVEPKKESKVKTALKKIVGSKKLPIKKTKEESSSYKRAKELLNSISKESREFNKGRSAASIIADARTKGKKAGKRESESGQTYYEYRPNRADVDNKNKPYLELGGQATIFSQGGDIPNNYEGKTPEHIWDGWTIAQRSHFLKDHYLSNLENYVSRSEYKSMGQQINEMTLNSWSKLPRGIQLSLETHVKSGQYERGGETKVSLKDAFSDFISSGTIANWTGENDYKKLDKIRLTAYELAPSSALYSIEAAKDLANIAKEEVSRLNKKDGGSIKENINVFGYETKNFDICPKAVAEFNAAIKQIDQKNISDAEKEDLSKMAQYIDKIFAIEKGVSEEGFEEALNDLMTAAMYNYRSGMLVNIYDFMNAHMSKIYEMKHESMEHKIGKDYMAKGGRTRVIRGFSDDEEYEYGQGGKMDENKNFAWVEYGVKGHKFGVQWGDSKAKKDVMIIDEDMMELQKDSSTFNNVYQTFLKAMSQGKIKVEPYYIDPNEVGVVYHTDEDEAALILELKGGALTLYSYDEVENKKRDIISKVANQGDWDRLYDMITDYMKKYKSGGHVRENENGEMLKNQVTNLLHHANELNQIVENSNDIEPWVITKAQRAVTDLADITHYLEGESKKMANGGLMEGQMSIFENNDMMAKGGQVYGDFKIKIEKEESPYTKDYKALNVKVDKDGVPLKYILQALVDYKDKDYLNQALENKTVQVFVKVYTRYVPLGHISKNTYDSFVQMSNTKEMADGGMMAKGGKPRVTRGFSDDEGYEYGDGGYMAKGGKILSAINRDRNYKSEESWEQSYKRKSKPKNPKYHYQMADGGYMAKGGINGKGNWVRNQDDNGWYYYIADAPKVKTPYSISVHEDIDIGDKKIMGYSVQRGGTNEMGYVKNYAIKKFKTLSEAENYAHKWMKEVGGNYAEGGMMAKGGMMGYEVELTMMPNYDYDSYDSESSIKKSKKKIKVVGIDDAKKKVSEFIQSNDLGSGNFVPAQVYKNGLPIAFISYNGKVWEGKVNNPNPKPYKMAMGGETFEGKVKSIKSSLLSRKKVSPSVQKDYGKTYSPKEAEDSAKRIVGAMTARERMKTKMRSKKSK